MRVIAYILLYLVAFVALTALDDYNRKYDEKAGLQYIQPCDTNEDCRFKNPHVIVD